MMLDFDITKEKAFVQGLIFRFKIAYEGEKLFINPVMKFGEITPEFQNFVSICLKSPREFFLFCFKVQDFMMNGNVGKLN